MSINSIISACASLPTAFPCCTMVCPNEDDPISWKVSKVCLLIFFRFKILFVALFFDLTTHAIQFCTSFKEEIQSTQPNLDSGASVDSTPDGGINRSLSAHGRAAKTVVKVMQNSRAGRLFLKAAGKSP